MKTLPPQKLLLDILSYDPETGILTWKKCPRIYFKTDWAWKSWNSKFANSTAGNKEKNGYIRIAIKDESYKAHRLIAVMIGENISESEIDHINHDRSDNRWGNLRIVSHPENGKNQAPSKNNKSGFNGVSWSKISDKWRAYINVGPKQIHLGCFAMKSDAIAARESANIRYGFHQYHGATPEEVNNY